MSDKEGYLRSHTALIQTIGRAARHLEGRVILYADKITQSMRLALDETERRRTKQMAYNKAHNITPQGIQKDLSNILESVYEKDHTSPAVADKKAAQDSKYFKTAQEKKRFLKRLEKDMLQAAEKLDFEKAAALRDQLHTLEKQELL